MLLTWIANDSIIDTNTNYSFYHHTTSFVCGQNWWEKNVKYLELWNKMLLSLLIVLRDLGYQIWFSFTPFSFAFYFFQCIYSSSQESQFRISHAKSFNFMFQRWTYWTYELKYWSSIIWKLYTLYFKSFFFYYFHSFLSIK
jgi:hypothetical protein